MKPKKDYKNQKRKKIKKPPNWRFFLYLIIWYNKCINQKRIPQYNTKRSSLSINFPSVELGNTERHRNQKD